MSVSAELERLDAERPTPPALLFKYVSSDRVDVLKWATIRFTPPLNTNDIFEIRQTFDLMMGPKMLSFFKESAPETDIEDPLRKALDEMGLTGMSNQDAKASFSKFGGGDLEATMRSMLDQFIEKMPDLMNTPANVDRLLQRLGSQQLLLSLSETPVSSPMWAHYAANSAGFVIAFDTMSPFFRRGEKYELQGLHKVAYFDGKIAEVTENPYAALVSKQVDWSYEREWRLYVSIDKIDRIIRNGEDEIHLVSFPRSAIKRVILGVRASRELEATLRELLVATYDGVPLMRLKADRSSATFVEELA